MLTVRLQGASVFMFLSNMPTGLDDEEFLQAAGTAVFFDNLNDGPRVLRTCSVDHKTGSAQSWIFDAIGTR